MLARGPFEEVWRHSSNCHNLSVTCRMCVNVNPPATYLTYVHSIPLHSTLCVRLHPSAHPLGRDHLWQGCRSVVINIYYVTCMQVEGSWATRPFGYPATVRRAPGAECRLLAPAPAPNSDSDADYVPGHLLFWYFNMLHAYESSPRAKRITISRFLPASLSPSISHIDFNHIESAIKQNFVFHLKRDWDLLLDQF